MHFSLSFFAPSAMFSSPAEAEGLPDFSQPERKGGATQKAP